MKKLHSVGAAALRALACVFATLALVLGATPAFAATTGAIVVTGVESGTTGTAYKIIDVNWDETNQAPNAPMYSWDASVASWVRTYDNGRYASFIGAAGDGTTPDDNSVTDAYNNATAADREAFFEALQLQVKDNAAVTTATATASGDTLTFDGLAMGGYLITAKGTNKVYNPIVQSVTPTYVNGAWAFDGATVSAAAKSNEPGFQKKINEGGNLVDSATASIGNYVTFNLQADVLSYPANAVDKTFTVSDTLSAGLTYVDGPLDVKADGRELVAGTDYKFTVDETGHELTYEFNYDSIANASKVVIEYQAEVNKDAVVGADGNPNTAKLIYSNDPVNGGTYAEIPDDVTVYTFGIDVLKVDKADGTTPLTGAEFKLYAADGKTELYFVKLADGQYRLANANEQGADTKLVVDGNGKINVRGLKDGAYKLEETKAPAGYTRLSGKLDVKLEAQRGNDGELTGDLSKKGTSTTVGYYGLSVPNSHGWSLPQTGDMGLFLFVAAGVLLVGGGALVIRGRRA